MRTIMRLAVMAVAVASAWAAVELPQASPAATVSIKVGSTEVRLTYHRPGVKGRTIWGGLVPYGQVWRLGANEATTIEVSDPVRIAGHDVPAGTYALFAIPGRQSWTFIVNKDAKQWGAFDYKQADDVARFEATPQTAPAQEWMLLTVDPTGPQSAEVALAWEKLRVAFPIEVEVPSIVWGAITKRIAGPDATWQDYFDAARYSLDQGGHRAEALGWADRAVAAKPMFWTYEVKARVLQREGRTAEALALLDKAMADATGKTPAEYIDELRATAAEWRGAGKK